MFTSTKAPWIIAVTLFTLLGSPTIAREWTDATGRYKFKGKLVAVGDTMVILQRDNKAKDIVAVDLADLSKADRDHLEKTTEENKANPEMRTYTTRSGLRVRAAVIGYDRRNVKVYRHRGKVYVNGYQYEKLPGIYRRIVPEVVNHFERTELTEKSLANWVKELKGARKSYECEGVLAELENGDHYAFPFFLLSKVDAAALRPGYEEWVAAKDNEKLKEEYSMRVRATAIAEQKKDLQKQEFAKLHLLLLGVDVGLTDLWEVSLLPPNGRGIPRYVVVPGRNSREARNAALAKFPGYRVGAARTVAN